MKKFDNRCTGRIACLMLFFSGCTNYKPIEPTPNTEKIQPAPKVTAFSVTSSAIRKAAVFNAQSSVNRSVAPKIKYRAGENPEFAKDRGWPVKGPALLPGSILPHRRIVAYYGNPLSKKMGVLGEFQTDEMLRRLKGEVAAWQAADPATPVQPALHLIAVVAQGEPGKDGK